MPMKGLELSERFYRATVDELFDGWDDVRARHAAGLVGEGSECFGFDDRVSQDHDFGPAYCIWLSLGDFNEHGAALQKRYETIAARGFDGYAPRVDAAPSAVFRRVGVLCTDDFYARFLGVRALPRSLDEWRSIPESNLAAVTNGRVFEDGFHRFSDIRARLLSYYPNDIRLRKIASGCMHAAQSGQYNFLRQGARGEDVAAFQALAAFADAVEQIAYALAKCYKPFYKWAHRGLRGIGPVGSVLADMLENALAAYRQQGFEAAGRCVEDICVYVGNQLCNQGLSDEQDAFLIPHAQAVNALIQDDVYRRTNLMEV